MIEVIGIEGSEEHAVAKAIATALATLWPGLDASPADEEHVRIAANCKLSGYKVSDIDVVVAAAFNRPRYFVPRKPVLDKAGAKATGRRVRVYSLVAAIEVKGQGPDGVRVSGDEVNVRYPEGWKSATDQNIKQVHALASYFKHQWADVHVHRCLALQGLSELPRKDGAPAPQSGAVALGFTGTDLLAALAGVNGIAVDKRGDLFLSSGPADKVAKALAAPLFREIVPSRLDRARMLRIASQPVEATRLAGLLGRERVHVRGRGGTGKTVLMLQAAHEAYSRMGQRTLVLTYNHALAADIQRLLALMGVPGGSEGGGIEVRTAMSYAYAWLDRLGVVDEGEARDLDRYEAHCQAALDLMDGGALGPADIAAVVASDPLQFEFDAVVVDEAQDWPQVEADLLARIHGGGAIALADGLDQLVRGQPTNWKRNAPAGQPGDATSLSHCLRMKRNLGIFANEAAHEGRLAWKVDPSEEAAGGRVILVKGSYAGQVALQAELVEAAREAGNEKIDFLHCVPPSNVRREDGKATSLLGQAFRAAGHETWDGVDLVARRDFPRSVEAFRIVQYDSCRGLEGWTTVLEGFDEFWDYKHQQALARHGGRDVAGHVSPDEAARFEAWRWAMIALTRPVDTLVISFTDPASPLSIALGKAAARHADFVETR